MTGYLVNDTRKVTTHRFIEMKQRGEIRVDISNSELENLFKKK